MKYAPKTASGFLPKLALGVMSGAHFCFFCWNTIDTDTPLAFEPKYRWYFLLQEVGS